MGHKFHLLSARYYIFTRGKHKNDLHLSNLQKLIKETFIEQEMLSRVNNTLENFEKRLSLWIHILLTFSTSVSLKKKTFILSKECQVTAVLRFCTLFENL